MFVTLEDLRKFFNDHEAVTGRCPVSTMQKSRISLVLWVTLAPVSSRVSINQLCERDFFSRGTQESPYKSVAQRGWKNDGERSRRRKSRRSISIRRKDRKKQWKKESKKRKKSQKSRIDVWSTFLFFLVIGWSRKQRSKRVQSVWWGNRRRGAGRRMQASSGPSSDSFCRHSFGHSWCYQRQRGLSRDPRYHLSINESTRKPECIALRPDCSAK